MAKGRVVEYTESQEIAARRLKRVGYTVERISQVTGLPQWLAYKLTRDVPADRDGTTVLQRFIADTIIKLQPGDAREGLSPLPQFVIAKIMEADKKRDVSGELTITLLGVERQK